MFTFSYFMIQLRLSLTKIMILNTQIIKSAIKVNVSLKVVFVSVFHYDLLKFFKRLPCSPVSFLSEISFLISIDNFKTGSYMGLCEIEYQYYFSQSKSRHSRYIF